ncbi:hypothetical protein HYG86_05485 [Alkalicella caledoniensis]|uniref:Uncharacterized protein n=1 Tax=Alkalicella caledoniensis TaxID=2731377 RepID=A0A7G9W6F0_ALKCA|nr:hypothetical protein [Alkalicella caledoniensis]QNO14262.1 hypothetical protein HYG86_05485 [Alkalicella caledoniensis]
MWVIRLLIIICGLVYIYNQCEKEDNVVLKLIGYFLLGSFLFRFNGIPIPVGMIVFFILAEPTVNKEAKTRAAYLGVVILLIGIISPMISNYIFERPVKVDASSSNLYMLNFKEDWGAIKEKIESQSIKKIRNFRVSYEKDGEIREFHYEIIGYSGNEMILYKVKMLLDKQIYLINAKKMSLQDQYERLVSVDKFFEVLEEINPKEIDNSEGNLDYYILLSSGQYTTSSEYVTHFQYIDGNMTPVDTTELPISGFYISNYRMTKISETPTSISHIGTDTIYYWFKQW